MKGYVTKVELVRQAGKATLRTIKTVETPAGVQTVEDRTPMQQAQIDGWLRARGWQYVGLRGGSFTYKPGPKAVTLVVEV
jgi:hypothetical protein